MSGLVAGLDHAAAQAEQTMAACMRMQSVPAARSAQPACTTAAPGAVKRTAVPRRPLLLHTSMGWMGPGAGS